MPALVLFGRRWRIASDDFVYPGLLETTFRTVWLLLIGIVFIIYHDTFDCTHGYLLRIYYIGTLVFIVAGIVLAVAIVIISMQGTIMNDYPRRWLSPFLYLKIAMGVLELVWNILGTYWAFTKGSDCDPTMVRTIKAAVVCGWCFGVIIGIGILVLFDRLGGAENQGHNAVKVWEKRCRMFCFCARNDEASEDAFSDVAKLVASFFQDFHLVPTDIAAGLILVHKKQQTQLLKIVTADRAGAAERPIDENVQSTGEVNQLVVPEDWMSIPLITHYMKFALAMYGWPLFLFMNTCTGCCQLCSRISCFCCRGGNEVVSVDNCCRCHTAAFERTTLLDERNIIYGSFHDEIYKIPFFVVVDRCHQAVVVVIRGTLSMKDALTDMTADTEPIDIDGVDDCFAHKGILLTARNIQEELEKKCLLEKGFEKTKSQKLVITGHSLGAGAAAILSVLLRKKYPNLTCFAYSPPGGLLSLSASTYTKKFICSVILGHDLVPRLGLGTMENLKMELIQTIKTAEIPKYKIFVQGCWQVLCGVKAISEENIQESQPLLQSSHLNTYRSIVLFTDQENVGESTSHQKLFPPGSVLFIDEEQQSASLCSGMPTYNSIWCSPENFSGIIVSPRMLSDHMPDSVIRALQQLNSKHHSENQV